jgi:hypothetical protein
MRLPGINEVLAWRCRRYQPLLWRYIDGVLDARQQALIETHLPQCERCRTEYEELRFARQQVLQLRLPDNVPSKLPAWLQQQPVSPAPEPSVWAWPRWASATAVVLLLLLAGTLAWYLRKPIITGWEVTRLAGTPVVGAQTIVKNGQIKLGEWLETDKSSRALLRVGEIGYVEIEPDSRVRLLTTRSNEHRLALVKGRLSASILAPPRLFFIETPSAEAIDYGCAYTLEVDESGASLLQVTAGWVSLKALGQISGREALVPAGALCRALPQKGPGTPFFQDASEKFRRALDQLNFADGGSAALAEVLAEARQRDSLTLFHLLPHVTGGRTRTGLRTLGRIRAAACRTDARRSLARAADRKARCLARKNRVRQSGWQSRLICQATTGTLRPTGTLNMARYAHTATLLSDGRVLVTGGLERDRVALNSAEIYDPKAGQFSLAGPMTTKRTGHTATLLRDGRVLLTGGSANTFYQGALASAEIYDPAKGSFRAVGSMSAARLAHRATLLPDGRVLITGGQAVTDGKLNSAEIYDPATETFQLVGSMHAPRADHTATLLNNGLVLIVGGGSSNGPGEEPVASAELYDPAQQTFRLTGSMSVVRFKHSATLLPDGRVIVIGGTGVRLWESRYSSSEIYDPVSGKFTPSGSLNMARYKIRDAVVLLPSGKIPGGRWWRALGNL